MRQPPVGLQPASPSDRVFGRSPSRPGVPLRSGALNLERLAPAKRECKLRDLRCDTLGSDRWLMLLCRRLCLSSTCSSSPVALGICDTCSWLSLGSASQPVRSTDIRESHELLYTGTRPTRFAIVLGLEAWRPAGRAPSGPISLYRADRQYKSHEDVVERHEGARQRLRVLFCLGSRSIFGRCLARVCVCVRGH